MQMIKTGEFNLRHFLKNPDKYTTRKGDKIIAVRLFSKATRRYMRNFMCFCNSRKETPFHVLFVLLKDGTSLFLTPCGTVSLQCGIKNELDLISTTEGKNYG